MYAKNKSFYLIIALLLVSTYSQIVPSASPQPRKTSSYLTRQPEPIVQSNIPQSNSGQVEIGHKQQQVNSQNNTLNVQTKHSVYADSDEDSKKYDDIIDQTFAQINGADSHVNHQKLLNPAVSNPSQQAQVIKQENKQLVKDKVEVDYKDDFPSVQKIKVEHLPVIMS